MPEFQQVRDIVIDVLKLTDGVDDMNAETPLLGHFPEFDSMAVVELIAALEGHYGFEVFDDDIELDTFDTLGDLTSFVQQKAASTS